ncbi:MAG TPA: 2,3-diaminopropionate biosynthesis protein SbnB [Pyrinomonadaceae bacterium]
MLILRSHEVISLLEDQEQVLIDIVQRAYEAHAQKDSSLPHSTFLRFPGNETNRIIALPAYLGQEFGVAGVKWISSFPGNLSQGMERASAVVVLNSPETGRPQAFIEGSIISAKRTAASAALAAKHLHNGHEEYTLGIVGAGLINFEIVKSLFASGAKTRNVAVFDIDAARALQFKNKCETAFADLEVTVEKQLDGLFEKCSLVSFATTATEPYVSDLTSCRNDATILHISLRDLMPQVILSCENVADDVDHACRANTSLHLAEQLVGNRSFVNCELADILLGKFAVRQNGKRKVVFSPFGLGVLDLAVSKHVYDLALQRGVGTPIYNFFSSSWLERN